MLAQTDGAGVPWAEGTACPELWTHGNIQGAERYQHIKVLEAMPGSLGHKTM